MTVYAADFGPDAAAVTPGLTEYSAAGAIVVARTTSGIASIGNGVFAKDFTPNASTGVLVWDALDLTASEPVYPAGGLDAAGVRTAIGMASANLDTQLAALPTDAETAVAVLAATVEGVVTVAESLRIQNAVLAGKVSGAGTGTETFRGINDDKDRVVATTDSSGNRTAITLDGS